MYIQSLLRAYFIGGYVNIEVNTLPSQEGFLN